MSSLTALFRSITFMQQFNHIDSYSLPRTQLADFILKNISGAEEPSSVFTIVGNGKIIVVIIWTNTRSMVPTEQAFHLSSILDCDHMQHIIGDEEKATWGSPWENIKGIVGKDRRTYRFLIIPETTELSLIFNIKERSDR
jgi:hypothetical protein